MIYWDYNATAPLRALVKEKVLEALERFPGNASSSHCWGQQAKAYIENVRRLLCECIGLKPTDLIFCGSATEANMIALWGHWFFEKRKALKESRSPRKLLVCPLEHSSIEKNVNFLVENEGLQVESLPLNSEGLADLKELEKILNPNDYYLVVLHAASNETGILQPWETVAEICKDKGVPFHSDLVQVLGRFDLKLSDIPVSSGTLAFHKSGGLKAIGAYFIRHSDWMPVVVGGEQEKKRRAGTENILGIASVEALCMELSDIIEIYQTQVRQVRDQFEKTLKSKISSAKIVGEKLPRLPNTSYCIFPGVQSDIMLMSLDVANICASAGSACSSGLAIPSSKLQYLGYSLEEAACGVRFSMGESSRIEQIEKVVSVIDKTLQRMAA